MANLTWMVLVWCTLLLMPRLTETRAPSIGAAAQPGGWELLGDSMAAAISRSGFQSWDSLDISGLRFSAPPENHPIELTYVESFDPLSRRFLLQQVVAIPVPLTVGTLSLNLQLDERTVSQNLWLLRDRRPTVADAGLPAADRSSLRVAGKWEDRRKDWIEASASWRNDFPNSAQPVEGVALSVKSILPAVWLPWNLQGEVRADSTGAAQEVVSLTADYQASEVARILISLGITRRDFSKGPRQRQGSYIVNTGCQWRQDDHLRLGISVKYYFDAHLVESILYLQLGQPMRAP